MNVALVGYALQNEATLRYFQQQGATITICDQNPELVVPAGVQSQLGLDYLKNLDRFDLIVRTDGIHPHKILEQNPGAKDKLTTAINLFFENNRTPVIGVTGTKGKGTTSTLIAKILEAAGKRVVLGGNIGVPALDLLAPAAQADYVVLELSSFQLIDCDYSPHIGICLMVVPEHLNWHQDLDEYVGAKQHLFMHQTADDLAVFNRHNALSHDIAAASAAPKVSYEVPGPGAEPSARTGAFVDGDTLYMNEVPVCRTDEIALLGRHNLENICASIAATWELINHDTAAIKTVVGSFAGLEHRLELVAEVNGVKYYDDSFGTTPETAIVAIQAFSQPKVVILGGSDKGAEFDALAHVVAAGNVKAAVLIGDTAPKIRQALQTAGFTAIVDGGKTMDQIMTAVQAQAAPGDVVLLSTGCASFGLFKDYKDRGNQFKQAVQALAAAASPPPAPAV